MAPRFSSRSFSGSLACLALLCWQGSASAQIPDKFTNLKILPKTIAKDELVSTMRQFSVGLGVRCNFCHAEADSTKGKGLDFASDAKSEKKIARVMMTMADEINTKLIPRAEIKSPARVACVTCHHGLEKPETLTDALKKTIEKDGVTAGIQRYKELREKYYGSGAYDFRPFYLNAVAEWLAHERKDADGAISIAKLSIEQDPKAADTYSLLGMIQSTKGDKAAAIESYKHALELDPENHRTQDLLKALQSEK